MTIFGVVIIIIFLIIIFKSIGVATGKESVNPIETTIKKPSSGQTITEALIIVIGILGSVFTTPVILIIAVIFKLIKLEGTFVTSYYSGVNILLKTWVVLIVVGLIAFGVCFGIFAIGGF